MCIGFRNASRSITKYCSRLETMYKWDRFAEIQNYLRIIYMSLWIHLIAIISFERCFSLFLTTLCFFFLQRKLASFGMTFTNLQILHVFFKLNKPKIFFKIKFIVSKLHYIILSMHPIFKQKMFLLFSEKNVKLFTKLQVIRK